MYEITIIYFTRKIIKKKKIIFLTLRQNVILKYTQQSITMKNGLVFMNENVKHFNKFESNVARFLSIIFGLNFGHNITHLTSKNN